MIGEAEQLIACPGSGSTDLNKTEVCEFAARKKGYEAASVSGFCENVGEFSNPLVQLVHTSGAECMRQ